MMGYVYDNDIFVGELAFDGKIYSFSYDKEFLDNQNHQAISLTLPKQKEPFFSSYLHPFFTGLLAEGNMKELQCKKLNIDSDDEFTRLLKTASDDTIGTVTIREKL